MMLNTSEVSMNLPPSPPSEKACQNDPLILNTAARVLQAQAAAISALGDQFAEESRESGPAALFAESLWLLRQTVLQGGKIVFSGMGKSHKIAAKLVATLHSFGIPALGIHPSDALHGDVGAVGNLDILVLISASGNSPELSELLRHVPSGIPQVCLTCNPNSELAQRSSAMLLAPITAAHREEFIYGLPAPTISTTLCLAIGDAMCIALYELLERDAKARLRNFQRFHPGGAIGLAAKAEASNGIAWGDIPQLASALCDCNEIDLWRNITLSPFIVSASIIYRSEEVLRALQARLPLRTLSGVSVDSAPMTRGTGLAVLRDETGQPSAVFWD